jgi:membrane fusion protein (multidrug efflux system)
VSLILADGTTFKHKGRVRFADRNIDPATGTLLVQTIFPNPEGLLRPGLYAKVKVHMNDKEDAIVIPQRSIMEMQGLFSVFVVNDSNTVKKVEIVPGYKTGNMQVIESGLKAGDRIVIDALQKVRTGLKINPVESDFKPIYQTAKF